VLGPPPVQIAGRLYSFIAVGRSLLTEFLFLVSHTLLAGYLFKWGAPFIGALRFFYVVCVCVCACARLMVARVFLGFRLVFFSPLFN
jgi:hypothetical protein